MMIEAGFWFLALTLGWLVLQSLLWSAALYALFDFQALRPAAWLQLYRGFLAGGTIRFDFVATLFAGSAVILFGELALTLRLASLIAWLPPLPGFRLALPPLRRFKRTPPPRRGSDPPQQPQQPQPKPQPPPEQPSSAPAAAPGGDSACMARMLALFEVWNEPPETWMQEAMREEAAQVSDQGWSLLDDLGAAGLRLAVLLEAQGLIPERPAVRALFDKVLAPPIQPAAAPALHSAEAAPALTMGAAWLCEILDNFVPNETASVDDMLGRAMRGMTEADWASLDRFPEKAGRVRVITDRLSEDLRRAAKPASAPPAELLDALLRQFGFVVSRQPMRSAILAEREDLALLLLMVDLEQKRWRLPSGPLGPWRGGDGADEASPGRALWQQLALLRLRRPQEPRLRGVIVAHDGSFDDEGEPKGNRADNVDLVWLTDRRGALPDLQHYLAALGDERVRIRPQAAASRRAAAPP
jgi:hypothetical protein